MPPPRAGRIPAAGSPSGGGSPTADREYPSLVRDPHTLGFGEISVLIDSDCAIVEARLRARELASRFGFGPTDITIISTAVSELARNCLQYAGSGEILIRPARADDRVGLAIVAVDRGPGIADPEQALADGYSSAHSLGLGLPGVRRLMDDFQMTSTLGQGTTVTIKKWLPAK